MEKIQSVGVVAFKENTVLLVREGEQSGHVTGVYNTPAGRIDEGETPIHAAAREFNEETGLTTNEQDLIELPKKYEASIPRKDGSIRHFYHTVFICKRFQGDLTASDETRPEWVPLDEVKNKKLLPNIEDMIAQGKRYLENK